MSVLNVVATLKILFFGMSKTYLSKLIIIRNRVYKKFVLSREVEDWICSKCARNSAKEIIGEEKMRYNEKVMIRIEKIRS